MVVEGLEKNEEEDEWITKNVNDCSQASPNPFQFIRLSNKT